MNIENDVLVVEGQRIRLPVIYSDTTVSVYRVPVDYRENGFFVTAKVPGEPAEIPACDFSSIEYLGDVTYAAQALHKVEAAKSLRLATINADCDVALGELSRSYPAGELQSWPQQVAEAAALQTTPPGPAPLLTSISEARGVPVAELARRVQEKANAYAEYSGGIIGKRQRLEDQLYQATTLEEVGAIQW